MVDLEVGVCVERIRGKSVKMLGQDRLAPMPSSV